MTEKQILIIVIIGLAFICGGLLVIIGRFRFKDDYKKKRMEFDDTDLIYWKDELRNNL